MYQGTRFIGGMLVVLGLLFPVGVWAYVIEYGPLTFDPARMETLGGVASLVESTGGDASAIRAVDKIAKERDARDQAAFANGKLLLLAALGILDLAVIGLGIGLRTVADAAEMAQRKSHKSMEFARSPMR